MIILLFLSPLAYTYAFVRKNSNIRKHLYEEEKRRYTEREEEKWYNTCDPRNILISVAIYVYGASLSYVRSRAKTFSVVVRPPPHIYGCQ
jgi:hypothetical protein